MPVCRRHALSSDCTRGDNQPRRSLEWTWTSLAFGETSEALTAGLQDALWALGGVSAVVRGDNSSTATHELEQSAGRDLTRRFRAVLDHYGLTSSRITPGRAHEDGVVEHANGRVTTGRMSALGLPAVARQ